MQSEKKYDYIIAGAGCAGYSLLYHMMQDPELARKKILIVDANFEKTNDRTWCFWEDTVGPFESIVCKKWHTIEVIKGTMQRFLPTMPFEYKMIQGIDFYEFIRAFVKNIDTISWQASKVTNIDLVGSNFARVSWDGGAATADYVFSSISTEPIKPTLWQHFKGIIVEFEEAVFDANTARLMDFNVPQMNATAFMYQLPLSEKKALIEYTLFSPTILEEKSYDKVIQAYMDQHYKGISYNMIHTEIGAIPMTTKKFAQTNGPIVSIGTKGDAVKASTGYAFQFIQQQTMQLVAQLKNKQPLDASVHSTRHQFYDAVLLYILEHKKMAGDEIFARIFKHNDAPTIFKFLSNSSNWVEDFNIMRSLPTHIFLPAALTVFFGGKTLPKSAD